MPEAEPFPSSRLVCLGDQALFRQVLNNLPHAIFDGQLVSPDSDFGRFGRLVWRRDSGEVLNLASPCLFVQPLGVPFLGLLQGNINEDLDEGQRVVAGL